MAKVSVPRSTRTEEFEEFFNQNHSHADGRFTSGGGTYSQRGSRPAEGRFAHMTDSQLARSSSPAHKAELEARKKANKTVYLSARAEEFYNKNHSKKDGRFTTSGGSVIGKPSGKPSTPHVIMKARELRQQKLAQTNRARANYGWKPIDN